MVYLGNEQRSFCMFLEPFDIIALKKELLPKWLMVTEILKKKKQSSSRHLMWTFGENVDDIGNERQ